MGLIVCLVASFAFPTSAKAQWTPPTGTKGWCAAIPAEVCFGDPQSACEAHHAAWGGPGQLYAYRDTKNWNSKYCPWVYVPGYGYDTSVPFRCASGFSAIAPGLCVQAGDNFASSDCDCDPNQGATPWFHTAFPISILDGGKSFSEPDFATADGALRVDRHYNSRPAGGAGDDFIGPPLGFANWRFGLGMELHIGDSWTASEVVGLVTPKGGQYQFVKSGAAMIPQTSTARPIKRTDYSLEFVGTFPANTDNVLLAPSQWIVRDRENRTWKFETSFNPNTGRFDIARPVRVIEPGGLEMVLEYADGALASVTDTYGRVMRFSWVRLQDRPRAIDQITLPDGTTLNYAYGSVASGGTVPERLVSVERRSGVTVLERETYDYADNRFPTFVTSVRDRDGATRWSVTYDDYGRALTSAGPGGTQAYSVAYGASGATFTRTVTGPLGKSEVYTFTRTSTNQNIRLTSIDAAASPNSPASTHPQTYSGNYLATDTDAEGRVTAYTRDSLARPTQVVEAQGTAVARTTGVTWHTAWNKPTQVTEPGVTTSDTLVSATSAGGPPEPIYTATQSFAFTGAAQTYTVPAGATSATAQLWGGGGGNGNNDVGAWSGAGGYLQATFSVAPGDVLTFEVAGGGQGAARNTPGGAGGWPDGGSGGYGSAGSGGGGGSTRFYINGVLKAVAGGGGGSGGYATAGSAGAGGGLVAQSAAANGGTGGSQTAGGVDSSASTVANKTGRSIVAFPGAQRTGGWGAANGTNMTSTTDAGGGGGGGYWGGGGGGGVAQSGGGGSSWVDPGASSVVDRRGYFSQPSRTPPGLPTIAAGVNSGLNGAAVAGGNGYAFVGLK